MLTLLNANRAIFAPTELLCKWVPTGDAHCPLVCVWIKARTKQALAVMAQSANSTLEDAQCA